MKHGTENKLKFKKLQRTLDLPLWQCKGLLQTLWDFAKENAPHGDVGKFTDDELAIGIDWRGEASELVNALVSNGWLDRAAEPKRLLIHDWWEHCEDGIHMALARHRQFFADGRQPKLSRIAADERSTIIADYERLSAQIAMAASGATHGERTETHAERTTLPVPDPALPDLTLPKPCHTSPAPAASHARPAGNKDSGVFADVGIGTLRDPERLDAWWIMASAQPKPIIGSSQNDRLHSHGAAVRALEAKESNKIGIFVRIITKQLWPNITQAQEAKAYDRIKELDRTARGDPLPAR